MKRLLYMTFGCIIISLSGCSLSQMAGTIGKVGQVIWDPSTPVGGPEDQPSQVTLSLLATETINPNPNSVPVAGLDDTVNKPLTVTVSAQSTELLREQLQKAIDQIDAPGSNASKNIPDTVKNNPAKNATDVIVKDDPFIAATGSTNTNQAPSSKASELQPNNVKEAHMVPELAKAIATPVSIKVLQLKDESMFLSADFDSLNGNMQQTLGSTYLAHDDYVLNPGQFKYIPAMEIDKRTRFIAAYAQFSTMDGATWKALVPIESRGRRYNLMISINGNIVTIQPDGSTNK